MRSCRFSFCKRFFFFFLISPSLRGGLGSREDWRKIKLCGPKRKNTFSFPSRGILRSLLALLHTLLSEWASTFEAFTKKSPPGRLQPASPCDVHRPRTAPSTASLRPADFYSFQNSPQRRREGCSTFLLVSSPPQKHHFPSVVPLSKRHSTSG